MPSWDQQEVARPREFVLSLKTYFIGVSFSGDEI